MKKAILSIDQGTTSTRAMVFDEAGKVVSSAQKEHQQIYPKSSWVEHDPNEIWQNTLEVIKDAIQQANENGFNPVTIGITNQRETIVAWDKKTGQVLHNALVWQDKRTAATCAKLKEEHGEHVHAKTGLPLDPYFSASKMQWLLENSDTVKIAAQNAQLAFGTIDSFLLYKLTGGKSHQTDMTNACRTLLFNIHTKKWDLALLELFNIPAHSLPDVQSNAFDFGTTQLDFLDEQLPIQGMAGDQQAASIGQACFKKGMLKSTYGTGCFAMLNTGEDAKESANGLLTTILYDINGETTYALEGSLFVAGSAIQWLRDRLGLIEKASETEELAREADDEDDIYFVPAFAGLGAPYWDSSAKGAIVGMTLDANKATVVRATLDAMAYQTHDLMKAMSADVGHEISKLRVDGGMVANNWLIQRMADILNLQIERPTITETTAIGAAYLAGLQNGIFKGLDDIEQHWQLETTCKPSMGDTERDKKISGWQHAIRQIQEK